MGHKKDGSAIFFARIDKIQPVVKQEQILRNNHLVRW